MSANAPDGNTCLNCGFATSTADWGGFCPDCGFRLPDREDSAVLEELAAVGDELKKIPAGRWMNLLVNVGFFMAIFGLLTACLVRNPGATRLVPETPVNLPNIIWLATGAPLFMYLGYLRSDFATDAQA